MASSVSSGTTPATASAAASSTSSGTTSYHVSLKPLAMSNVTSVMKLEKMICTIKFSQIPLSMLTDIYRAPGRICIDKSALPTANKIIEGVVVFPFDANMETWPGAKEISKLFEDAIALNVKYSPVTIKTEYSAVVYTCEGGIYTSPKTSILYVPVNSEWVFMAIAEKGDKKFEVTGEYLRPKLENPYFKERLKQIQEILEPSKKEASPSGRCSPAKLEGPLAASAVATAKAS